MFRFKLVLIVHFLSVSAVASGEHVSLSTISPSEAAMMKTETLARIKLKLNRSATAAKSQDR